MSVLTFKTNRIIIHAMLKKCLRILAVISFLFVQVVAIGHFHHHEDNFASETQCELCMMANQVSSTDVPQLYTFHLLTFTNFVYSIPLNTPFLYDVFDYQHQSRAPVC